MAAKESKRGRTATKAKAGRGAAAPGERLRRSPCPAAFTLDLLGDRWTMLIVRDLLLHGCRRYRDFLAGGEGIATNILADRLARLERAGIVESSRDPENRRAKLYRPTSKGLDLAPLLVELLIWGATHDPETGASAAWLRRARADRQAIVDEIVTRFEAEGHATRAGDPDRGAA